MKRRLEPELFSVLHILPCQGQCFPGVSLIGLVHGAPCADRILQTSRQRARLNERALPAFYGLKDDSHLQNVAVRCSIDKTPEHFSFY